VQLLEAAHNAANNDTLSTHLQEIDALIIGASYGTGELRGGKVSDAS